MRFSYMMFLVIGVCGMSSNVAMAADEYYQNCFVKEIGITKERPLPPTPNLLNPRVLEVTFSDCKGSSPDGPAIASAPPEAGIVLSAANNLERVDVRIHFAVDHTFNDSIEEITLTKTADLTNIKHGHNCWVERVDVSSRFKRCFLRSCQLAPKGLYEPESSEIFQMCMSAAMLGKRVKVTYVEKDGQRIITYMRHVATIK